MTTAETAPTCPCGKPLDSRGRSSSGLCRRCHGKRRVSDEKRRQRDQAARDLYLASSAALPKLREAHAELRADIKTIRKRKAVLSCMQDATEADRKIVLGLITQIAALRGRADALARLIGTIEAIEELDTKW